MLLIVLIIATVVSDYFGEPPNYLVGLLGTAAGAFFAAIGSDKQKRDAETRDIAITAEKTARRAEAKADHDGVIETTPPATPGEGVGSAGDGDGGGGGQR
ncbi:hypothetical protein SEA_ALANGRANT_17 [Mycobacterium phage AlanGrant]|uniref:Holin n=1 Tax=Mycobacterium phage AlanGrant TaxID=1647307 RepID=A0A0F6SJR6_9CAUD|nr:hypothetical protein SEA_ALANGRANT_17 [Mycobacterium phage AlanGrant]